MQTIRKIEVNDLELYSKCPMLLQYSKSTSLYKNSINYKYNSDIRELLYIVFERIKLNEKIRIKTLKHLWGKIWIKEVRRESLVFSESSHNDQYSIKRREGIDVLFFLHDYIVPLINDKKILYINKEVPVKISDSLFVDVTLDLILINEDTLELWIFSSEENFNETIFLNYNLKIVLSEIAIDDLFKDKKFKSIKIKVCSLKKRKIYSKQVIPSNKEKVKNIVKNIYKCIYNNIFYKSPDTKCISCLYKKHCGNDNFYISEEVESNDRN